jgi:hypothetical protein
MINLGFLTKGKPCCYIHHTFLLGLPNNLAIKVYYDGHSEMYFRGGWPQFAEDHELHQGFFMLFDYHCGTSKFNVKIYNGTQCQRKYEAEVHFH